MTLREARFKARKTQYDLMAATGIAAPRISLAERGFVRLKRHEREALASALGIKPEEISWTAEATGRPLESDRVTANCELGKQD
jgi:transcriptional regulator with XRE-family HTH domain